ncbi:rhodanese-like domain-containing protein [Polaribacter batillariae]|uniref:Rhodanese-like domain-containing protein n=1 Tax=Polaribacter batillariae TaxID=2808900 RepID=A0ABX7SXH9_9FLAO|nr:rhodanese-like domain-containing protein [Polaribacter batillariae]QTD38906.1 rhodanese-like domain-containing protein [Polaribacter batillariae]
MKKYVFWILVGIFFSSCDTQEEIKTISTKELKALLAKENIQLMDVRSPKEIKEGSIKTAMFANYFDNDFAKKVTQQLNKLKPVYLICRSGNRSGKACKILKEKGYNVINVSGGYNQWKKEN